MMDFLEELFSNTVVKMITALMIVGMMSGAVLVMVYTSTKPSIARNLNRAREQAIYSIFPGADKIKDTSMDGVWEVKGKNGQLAGYAFRAEGNGYQGTIQMIAGVDRSFTTMRGMQVLESQETPGLGAEIAGKDFRSQFRDLQVSHQIEYVKNEKPVHPYQIEAITGATISSRAVVNILNRRMLEIKKNLKGN
ncbi:MAG: RnfABCDGE type electron transport complex subunit G [Candidatus Omnitrophica bacterium]|nr:RnfABCDGE type electron transport complex subunit G [Candidatus Omnitrophota bacterium]